MAYTEFETEKAKYVFLAGFHSSSNPSAGKLQGIDALVLEGSKLVSCRLNFNFRKYITFKTAFLAFIHLRRTKNN